MQEKQQQAEVEQWEAALVEAKGRLLEATRTNTDKLQAATQLMQRHKKLDAALVATQTRAGGWPSGVWHADWPCCKAGLPVARHMLRHAQSTADQGCRPRHPSLAAASGGDPVAERQREVDERDRLVGLINSQAQAIQALQAQVAALSRKDVSVHG